MFSVLSCELRLACTDTVVYNDTFSFPRPQNLLVWMECNSISTVKGLPKQHTDQHFSEGSQNTVLKLFLLLNHVSCIPPASPIIMIKGMY